MEPLTDDTMGWGGVPRTAVFQAFSSRKRQIILPIAASGNVAQSITRRR